MFKLMKKKIFTFRAKKIVLTFICLFSGPPEPPENIAVLTLSLPSVRVEWDSVFTYLEHTIQCCS